MSITRWGIELGLNVRIYKVQKSGNGGRIGVGCDVFKGRGYKSWNLCGNDTSERLLYK